MFSNDFITLLNTIVQDGQKIDLVASFLRMMIKDNSNLNPLTYSDFPKSEKEEVFQNLVQEVRMMIPEDFTEEVNLENIATI